MLATIDTVIFDMDGVIFDSEKIYYDAFWVAADIHEVEADEDFVRGFEGKTTETCQLMLQNFLDNDFEKTRLFLRDWGEARQNILAEHGLEFKDGFLTLFEAVKASGRTVGLVTSSNYDDMRENFERDDAALLDEFDNIITIEDVKHPKPHPQPYQMMIRQLGKTPEQCVVIEDSISGISSAIAAGANTIMLNDYITPPPELADKLVLQASHHDEILEFLQNNRL